MGAPTIAEFEITSLDLLSKTILQIEKDWTRAGLESLNFKSGIGAAEVMQVLNNALNDLVLNQPDTLPTLLYLIDLNEAKLMWQSGQMTIDKLTEEIVKREFYKVKLRSIL